MKEKVYVSGPMNFTRTALESLTKPLAVLLLFLGLLNSFIGMMENDIVTILWGAIGPLFSYILTTLPEAQNQKNYEIKFNNENSLEDGFTVYLKGRQVTVSYIIDENGTFEFTKPQAWNCVSYSDGKPMGKHKRRCVANYIERYFDELDQ